MYIIYASDQLLKAFEVCLDLTRISVKALSEVRVNLGLWPRTAPSYLTPQE